MLWILHGFIHTILSSMIIPSSSLYHFFLFLIWFMLRNEPLALLH